MPSAAVFSSDLVKDHHIRQEDWQRVRWMTALGSLLGGINSRCEPGDASRKHSEGASSGGGIHHLRRPGAKASERCWSQLMISPPERCPVCEKHLLAHSGVLAAIKLAVISN